MIPVILETPYAGNTQRNTEYARDCMKDSLMRGEAPFLSHLLYTQVLDDEVPEERALGIEAGFVWGKLAKKVVVYTDLGVTEGMKMGIKQAIINDVEVENRTLPTPNP